MLRLWVRLLTIRFVILWYLWRKQPEKAAAYADRALRDLLRVTGARIEKLAAAARIDAPAPKITRIIRSTADIYKQGHVLTIEGKKFYVTRLLSASPKEVLYEAETK